ncbi:MAG: Sir2 family NAD-dependent protein deacetylase [Verrucomicrobiota bacterium]|jgi:NAD-dependent deacetylase|nr:Sir2 family NAD-dependent protein deacetylase [Verrucomicrobiota bacterium]
MAKKLSDWISDSSRILVFTGAGISTPSGIPAFRGKGGIWTTRQPVYYQDFMEREESRVEYWEYKLELWEEHGNAQPNIIHESIVWLEQAGMIEMVVTQNVDGLHRVAGTSEDLLVEVHGTGTLAECQTCARRNPVEASFELFQQTRQPPLCDCGGYLKPATISFGQNLREADLQKAFSAAAACDLVIALGSTLSVSPANTIPLAAAQAGVSYIIINRDETDHDGMAQVTLRLSGNVEEIFPPAVEKALAANC